MTLLSTKLKLKKVKKRKTSKISSPSGQFDVKYIIGNLEMTK